jgi:hypothetical protein
LHRRTAATSKHACFTTAHLKQGHVGWPGDVPHDACGLVDAHLQQWAGSGSQRSLHSPAAQNCGKTAAAGAMDVATFEHNHDALCDTAEVAACTALQRDTHHTCMAATQNGMLDVTGLDKWQQSQSVMYAGRKW